MGPIMWVSDFSLEFKLLEYRAYSPSIGVCTNFLCFPSRCTSYVREFLSPSLLGRGWSLGWLSGYLERAWAHSSPGLGDFNFSHKCWWKRSQSSGYSSVEMKLEKGMRPKIRPFLSSVWGHGLQHFKYPLVFSLLQALHGPLLKPS